ncbi:MAG: TIGR03087 family PEP-CTERM/XrtA system glycosyltransferase [Pseudomonadota bacterium]
MRDILFLAHRAPFPPDRGDKIRAYNVLKYLSDRARVHLVAFADDPRDLNAPELRAMCASHCVVPRTRSKARAALEALATGQSVSVAAFSDPAFRAGVQRALAGSIDAIYVFSSAMAQYLPPLPRVRTVMDFCDVDSVKFGEYAAAARFPQSWLYAREARLLGAFDRAIVADASLFVSEAEAALFRTIGGQGAIQVVENGIDTVTFDPAATFDAVPDAPEIVFTGQMDYAPNVAAVQWFANDVLPLIARPARFAIVGRAPTAEVQALANERVIVTGEVADVRGWVAGAAVAVAPLRIARGIQNKVLEAMAMARPVVVSSAAAEGIDHGGTLRIGEGAAGFAAEVSRLIEDRAAGDALGAAARARVQARYGWDARLAALDDLLDIAPDADGVGAASERKRA